MRSTLCGLLLLLGHGTAAAGLELREAWIREAPPTAAMLAGYAELANTGTAPLRVTAARSADFGAVELHEMRMDGGVMRMRALDAIEVPAGASVRLAPGGNHLMLMRPARALRAGDRVRIEFEVEGAAAVGADFVVRQPQ
jgi:copper(I)-binding protein